MGNVDPTIVVIIGLLMFLSIGIWGLHWVYNIYPEQQRQKQQKLEEFRDLIRRMYRN